MEILPFEQKYQEEVIHLILPIQQKEFNIPIDIGMQPDLKDVPGFYQKGNGNFWIALENNKLVGTIGLIEFGNAQGALRKMFVQEEYRGPVFGIAPLLLRTLLEWSAIHRIYTIYLGTREEFYAAQRFYEKNNFQEISKSSLPPEFPLMSTDNKFYKYSSIDNQ